MDERMQNQVRDILLMPIEITNSSGFGDKKKVEIKREGKVIKTTQTYWPEYRNKETGELFRYNFKPDCDMSDFACGFYKIIYKSILSSNSIVDNNGCMVNKQFAGDTMISVGQLSDLRDKYHCLANFWVIPMELGRQSNHKLSKTSKTYYILDYMERFLLLLRYKFDVFKNEFPDYFQQINAFNRMADIHFLRESYLDSRYNIKNYSDVIDNDSAKDLWTYIQNRAEMISKSEFGQDLWEYFKEVGIL